MSVYIPDRFMNKFICVDESTKRLLSCILPENLDMTPTEKIAFRKQNLELLRMHTNNMTKILQSLRVDVPKRIKLRNFLQLASYYHWNISHNINVMFFHNSFRKGALQRRIKILGGTLQDLANKLYICPTCLTASTKINYSAGSIDIFANVFKYVTQAEREYFNARPDAMPVNYPRMFKYDGQEVYI